MKKLFTVLPLVLATSAAMAYEQGKTYQFTILHTNDTHGHFWPNAKGEYGFPAHKTIVNRVKAEVEQKGGSLILLNAGDFNTGVPESDMPFCTSKGHLLPCKRASFTMQKMPFYFALYNLLII